METEIPSNPDQPELAPGVKARSIRWQFSRSSGPGGQNVNKVSTRAELWVLIEDLLGMHPDAKSRLRALAGSKRTVADEIHITADEERSQSANRDAALSRLRELIVQAQHRPKHRRKTKPSYGSKQRRIEGKKIRSGIKQHRQRPGLE